MLELHLEDRTQGNSIAGELEAAARWRRVRRRKSGYLAQVHAGMRAVRERYSAAGELILQSSMRRQPLSGLRPGCQLEACAKVSIMSPVPPRVTCATMAVRR